MFWPGVIKITPRHSHTAYFHERKATFAHKCLRGWTTSQRPLTLLLFFVNMKYEWCRQVIFYVQMVYCTCVCNVCDEIRIMQDIHLFCSCWGDWVGLGDMKALWQRITLLSLPFCLSYSTLWLSPALTFDNWHHLWYKLSILKIKTQRKGAMHMSISALCLS